MANTICRVYDSRTLLIYKQYFSETPAEINQFVNDFKKEKEMYKFSKSWKRTDSRNKTSWLLNKDTNDENVQKLSLIRSILNKMNEFNYDKLLAELNEIKTESVEILHEYADMFFEKVTVDEKFVKIYAMLCRDLGKISAVDDEENTVILQDIILERYQKEFKKFINLKQNGNDEEVDQEEQFSKKQIILNHIKFIGELYNEHIINEKVIQDCFFKLFSKIGTGCLHTVEICCCLMETIGKCLNKNSSEIENSLLTKLNDLSNDKNISKREKFMIMDTVDKKGNSYEK